MLKTLVRSVLALALLGLALPPSPAWSQTGGAGARHVANAWDGTRSQGAESQRQKMKDCGKMERGKDKHRRERPRRL